MLLPLPLLPALLVLLLPRSATGSSYADGGDGMACWKAKLMVPCDTIFPGVDIQVDWSAVSGSARLVEGDKISVPSHLMVPAAGDSNGLNITTADFKAHDFGIDHTNLHACKVSGGFCSPFVGEQPGLVTHSPALKGTPGPANEVKFEMALEPGSWTFITHYRIFIDDNIRCDFAKGKIAHVESLQVETVASSAVINSSIALSIIGMAISLFFLVSSTCVCRKTNVFKLASWKFCAIASLGGMLGNGCILLWVPPLTNTLCLLRPFLLPIAFDVLFFPLLLKTWRLKVLFANLNTLKRVTISDWMLIKGILAPVLVDAIIGIVWVLVDPPTPARIDSLISETRYEMFCASKSDAFLIVIFVMKLPFMLWGLQLAWGTRTVLSVMNESSHILLSMLNLFFVGTYVIVIQFLITDSQSALVMLRSLGTFIAASLTLAIVLGPKVVQLVVRGDVDSLVAELRKETTRRMSHIKTSSGAEKSTGDDDRLEPAESTSEYAAADEIA